MKKKRRKNREGRLVFRMGRTLRFLAYFWGGISACVGALMAHLAFSKGQTDVGLLLIGACAIGLALVGFLGAPRLTRRRLILTEEGIAVGAEHVRWDEIESVGAGQQGGVAALASDTWSLSICGPGGRPTLLIRGPDLFEPAPARDAIVENLRKHGLLDG